MFLVKTYNRSVDILCILCSVPPVAIVTHAGRISDNHTLRVVAEDGDPPSTFSCSANGFPTPTVEWGRHSGVTAVPSGVLLITSKRNLTLIWSRALKYTDSGNYICNATNSVGMSSVRLELIVRGESSFLL